MDAHSLWHRLVADLGWVDLSALTVMALFFLLGLFRGMVWQIGRAVAVIGGYGLAMRFGPTLAAHVGEGEVAAYGYVYLSYVVVFLLAFFGLSLLARAVRAMVQRAGLGLFDRLGGGLFGVATGGAVVIGLLAVVLMFGQRFPAYASVQASRAIVVSRTALSALGDLVPEPVQAAFSPPARERVATRPQRADTPALDAALRDVAAGR